MKKAITYLFIVLCLIFPQTVLGANYGSGHYGTGSYNIGELTPTTAPTIAPTNSPSSSNNTITHSAPSCDNSVPSTPKLFQIDIKNNSAKLFFTPLTNTNKFFIGYSTKTNAEEHGVEASLAKEGVQNFTINALKPNTVYYFKVRGQNGCMPGSWSGIVKAKTSSIGVSRAISYYMNNLVSRVTSIFSNIKLPKTKDIKTQTVVKEQIVIVTPVPQQKAPTVTSKQEVKQPTTKKQTCILWWCF
jgi:hypothetical protein